MASISALLAFGGGSKQSLLKTKTQQKRHEVSNSNKSTSKSKTSTENSLAASGSLASLDKPSTTRKKPRTTENPDIKTVRAYEEAIRRRDCQQVLWVIANGDVLADHEAVNGENAILAAVAAKSADAVRMLVDSGVSIDSANLKGYTPLMKAIVAAAPFAEATSVASLPRKALKQMSSLKLLHQNNSVNDPTNDPAQHQFDNGIVQVVLELKPDVLKRDLLGKTAFDWAKRTGNLPALQLLETYHRANSLHNTASSSREQRIAECLALLKRHEAIVAGIERFLAQHRFDEHEFIEFLKSSIYKLPLEDFANCVADLNVARVTISDMKLLENDPNASFFINHETKQGWTPLTKAASNGYVAATQVLVELGAQLNHETRLRHTALTWACYCSHEPVVLYLLRVGAIADQQTREGKTALIHAVCNLQTKIVHHLLLALREQSYPAKAKDAFDTEVTALNRRKSMKLAWKRVVGPIENRLEWHEAFGNLVHLKDQQGKSALDYAEELGRGRGSGDQADAANAALTHLRNATHDAQDHAQYVEKNEERTRRTKCKSPGCDFVGPRDLMPVHEQHQCLKRIVHCEQCTASIVFDTQDKHDRLNCEMRKVPCVNLQHGCHERVLCRDLQSHATYHCRKRLIDCRLQCRKTLRFDEIVPHETTQCPHRMVECALGCPATFLAKESGDHKRKHCPKRLVACVGEKKSKTEGCGASVAADEMNFHLAHLCEKRKFACQWNINGCDEAIGGSPESRYHHEHRECPFRPVACRNGCALSGAILDCFLSEHYKWQCVLEPKSCPNHCGEFGEGGDSTKLLPAHLMDVHVFEDAGDCEKRLTRCPLDLCGKRIRIFDLQHRQNGDDDNADSLMSADLVLSGTERRIPNLRALTQRVAMSKRFLNLLSDLGPDDSGELSEALPEGWEVFTRSETNQFLIQWLSDLHQQLESDLKQVETGKMVHATQCRVLAYAQADRKHLVEFSDGHSQWISLALREFEILTPQSPAAVTNDNSNSINPLTVFQCRMIQANQVASHTENECLLRLVPCPLECGQRLPSQGLSAHITKRCNMRNASCRLGCESVMPYLSMGEHEELHCRLRSVFCEHCHEQLKWQALVTHLQKSCEKVPRRCRFGCSDKVSWSEREAHEASECPKRLVKCAKCEKSIWFCEQQVHETHECPLREYGLCDSKCGETLKFNEIGHHLLFNCSQRVVMCHACDQRMVFAKIQEHKDLLCPQRFVHCRRGCGMKLREMDAELHEEGECSKRLVFCSNKCGVEVPCCALEEHLELTCEMRVIECPSGCQERVFAYQFENHWRRCRQRIFPCGTGSKACARPIRLWFADRKLVRCALHNENALLWALKNQDEDLVAYFLQNVQASQALQEEFANGFSALSMAVSVGNVDVVKLLLHFGADVNLETSRGRTALAEACMAQHVELVELLVEQRANVSQTNRQGRNLMSVVRLLAANSASAIDKEDGVENSKWKAILRLLEERETMERDQHELFVAIATSNYEFMAQFLKFSSSSKSKSARPGDQLEMLRQDLEEKEKLVQQAQAEHADAIRIFNESVTDTESKIVSVSNLSEQVLDCSSQIHRVDTHHDASLADSSAHATHTWSTRGLCGGRAAPVRIKQRARVLHEKDLLLVVNSRSDEAVNALIRNVAFTFLLSHFRRKIAFFRQTHRVALHEAIFNGFPQIAEILLANDAKLWQKAHVLPLKMFPGAIIDQDAHSQAASQHKLSGGWKLTPLTDDQTDSTSGAHRPMTAKETLELAMRKFDCGTCKAGKGWDPNATHYSDTHTFVSAALSKLDDALAQRRKEIAARKNVNKKALELKTLHAALEKAIINRDFHAVSDLLDQGAYADYETSRDGRSALMVGCIEELYVENQDKRDVLAVEFLLDRPTNHPFVNFESSIGHTALSTSAFHGTLLCAQVLIDRGVNVNQASRVHGKTALMAAAANGQTEFVRFLIRQPDIDVLMQDKSGKNAFVHARENGVCKWGCGFMTNVEGTSVQKGVVLQRTHPMSYHEHHTCPKRHLACPLECDAADIWAESLNYHVNKECRLRIVTCAQPKCGASTTQEDLEVHNRDECEFRTIHCSCGEQMTYQKHVVHAQNRCPMRLVPCPLDCGDSDTMLRFMDMKSHQNTECPNRRVRCRNGCSANNLLFKERGHHEAQLCPLRRVQCKWGCDKIVIANSQQHHESEECLVRQLACLNKRGQLNVVFAELEHHVAELCACRLVACTLGCGRKVPLHIMDNHVRSECRKRAVMCELCSQQLVEDDRVAHQSSSCSQRISLCGLCGQTNIPYGNLVTHRAEQCKMRQVQCKYKCFVKLLLAHEKERHETSECAFRPIWCPLGCRQVFVANTLKKHERVCEMRFVVCSLGCGTELREKDRLDHERSECSHSRQRQRQRRV